MPNFLYNIYPIMAEIFIVLNANILLIYGVLLGSSLKFGHPLVSQNLNWLTFQILALALLFLYGQEHLHLLSWNNLLITDSFAYGAKFIVLLISFSWLLMTSSYPVHEKLNSFEYWILILLSIVAILLILQSCDLLIIYLSIEFQSLIFYVLASFKRTSEFSTESGLKYFVLGAFSSALFLFGCSLIYGLTGLTNLADLSKFFTGVFLDEAQPFYGIYVGLLLIIVSLLFKLSLAPFHMWSPDVYEGAPTPITAFFSLMPKLGIVSLLIRILIFSFHDFLPFWRNIILISAILSILLGTLSAFSQTKWKRFLAYSSIVHVGFTLLPLLVGNPESISNTIFYLIVYMITTLGVFSFILSLRFVHYPTHHQTRYLQDLTLLSKVNPVLALSMTIFLFSMAGIPPLAGFFSKVFALLPALYINALGVSIFVILISCISCFYYIKLIKNMYFDNPKKWSVTYPIDKFNSFTIGLATSFSLLIFYDIEFLSIISRLMSLSFLN